VGEGLRVRGHEVHVFANPAFAGAVASAGLVFRAVGDEEEHRRGLDDERLLCAGPGRLCQALGITRDHDGLPLDEPPFELLPRTEEPEIATGPRIGITRAVDRPWRYVLAGSRYLSRSVRPRSA